MDQQIAADSPAILGGTAVRPGGTPSWPAPDDDVRAVLEAAFRSGSWGLYHGPNGAALEAALRERFAIEHVHLCGSGTFAVELGLRAFRIGSGDEVILAAYDFPGNFLSIHAVGALPVLVDLDASNWTLSLEALKSAASSATRAVIVSHLHGGIVPMRELTAWAAERKVAVLEDACQCPGAMIEGRPAGTWGDAGVVSFGGTKLLSAGRGGALLTRHADVAQRARTANLRGNLVCPLSELQAAVLLPQLDKLAERNKQRDENVFRLCAGLGDVPGLQPFVNVPGLGEPGFYKVGFQYDATAFGLPRQRFVDAIRAEGVAFAEGFPAAHVGRSPKRFRRGSDLTEAERAHEGCVVLHHPVLLRTVEEIADVGRAVHKIYRYRQLCALRGPNAEFGKTFFTR